MPQQYYANICIIILEINKTYYLVAVILKKCAALHFKSVQDKDKRTFLIKVSTPFLYQF